MSKIKDIIDLRERMADKGQIPSEYQRHLDTLRSLDILVDTLQDVALAMKRDYEGDDDFKLPTIPRDNKFTKEMWGA